jgi:hypothetical protein
MHGANVHGAKLPSELEADNCTQTVTEERDWGFLVGMKGFGQSYNNLSNAFRGCL